MLFHCVWHVVRTIKELHLALKDVEQATRETQETVKNVNSI